MDDGYLEYIVNLMLVKPQLHSSGERFKHKLSVTITFHLVSSNVYQ